MKSLTIHNMEPDLAAAIENLAEKTGLSQNKVIKKILRRALNLDKESAQKADFSEFLAVWSEEDFQEFQEAIAPLEKEERISWDENKK